MPPSFCYPHGGGKKHVKAAGQSEGRHSFLGKPLFAGEPQSVIDGQAAATKVTSPRPLPGVLRKRNEPSTHTLHKRPFLGLRRVGLSGRKRNINLGIAAGCGRIHNGDDPIDVGREQNIVTSRLSDGARAV